MALTFFLTRNIDRISKEYKQYAYNPLISVFYKVEDSYFDLDEKIRKMKKIYNSCIIKQTECGDDEMYDVKKILNFYVFIKND